MEKKTTSNDDNINKIMRFTFKSDIAIQMCLMRETIFMKKRNIRKGKLLAPLPILKLHFSCYFQRNIYEGDNHYADLM